MLPVGIFGHRNRNTQYLIEKSAIFDSADSSYLARTPGVAGDRKTWTFSTWVKRSKLTTLQMLFAAGPLSTSLNLSMYFNASDALDIGLYNVASVASTAVFRDVSEWYHVICTVDTTLSSGRIKAYVNGVEVISSDLLFSQNSDTPVNNTELHEVGRRASLYYINGYLADTYLIDGLALDPSYFGETDVNNRWVPKAYSGSYGTNGFYQKYDDATDFGKDVSGQGNHFTQSGMTTNHQVEDSPTNNYCTLNGLDWVNSASALSDGALTHTGGSYNYRNYSTFVVSTGKWYVEYECIAAPAGTGNQQCGFIDDAGSITAISCNSNLSVNGVVKTTVAWTDGDIIGIAVDLDTGTVSFYKNNTIVGSAYSLTSTGSIKFNVLNNYPGSGSVPSMRVDFGQRGFTYTPPSGYKALCSNNLPEPDIILAQNYFDVVLDTGANIKAAAEAVFGSGLFWIKDRDNANNHQLIDYVRGTSAVLQSNTTAAETTYSAPSGNSVAWCFKEGVIPGFDIATYVGTGVAQAINHGLGVVPEMIILKSRDGVRSWGVYHKAIGPTGTLYLDITNAANTASFHWNDTAPTTTDFTVGIGSVPNSPGENYIAYLFASIPGFSKVFSYTGNDDADGPFISLDFQPAYIMVKRADSTGNWIILDASRSPSNDADDYLHANITNGEFSNTSADIDFLSNGLKIRTGNTTDSNASGGTYIGIAFAEHPLKYGRAR